MKKGPKISNSSGLPDNHVSVDTVATIIHQKFQKTEIV